MNRCFSILLAALLPGTLLFAAEDETPAELKPYTRLAEQCGQHDSFVAATSGSLVEEFATATNQTWKALPTQFAAPKLELRKVDDRTVLAITSLNDVTVTPNLDAPALIAVGPPIVGSVRLEMVAYSNTDNPCDLSLLLGPVAKSPGFQFGAYRNTRNILWADTGETNSWQAVRLPPVPLITPRRWHTVRLDIADRELIASVDGKILGRTALSDQFDLKTPLQPTIYCYDSSILVDRFTITRAASGTPAELKALAWKRTFGALTQADVDKKITELVVLLDHENSKVRDGAQTLLTKIGLFAQPALRQAIKTGTIEQRLRAKEILGFEPGSQDTPPPPPMTEF
jgi:hypothetical protein